MEETRKHICDINRIKGKTIALVYIFEGDNSGGFEHFFIWKSNIITKWMNAIQDLHCLPLILDVRTFVDKAMNKTLPHIDYVLNMNSGTYDLSTMALVPSACSAIGVPCIPCNAVSIILGENKLVSNYIAETIGLNVPKKLSPDDHTGIFRPINLGNSLGVQRGCSSNYKEGIYQEFIAGYEITTPVVFNPVTSNMELLPTVMYLPESKDLEWYNGENEKIIRQGYKMKIVDLEQRTKNKYIELVNSLSVKNYCRIDARVKCSAPGFYHRPENTNVMFENTYFIEINVMPTIRENNNFVFSYDSVTDEHPIYSFIKELKLSIGNINVYSFLLANSMLSYLKN